MVDDMHTPLAGLDITRYVAWSSRMVIMHHTHWHVIASVHPWLTWCDVYLAELSLLSNSNNYALYLLLWLCVGPYGLPYSGVSHK